MKTLLFIALIAFVFGTGTRTQDVPKPIAINFYGKVVDENDHPVAGAKVSYNVTNMGDPYSETGLSEGTSNEKGSFSLTGKTGYGVGVSVSKDGYYTPNSEDSRIWIPKAENSAPLPTQDSPAIFHLRKKGFAEPLKEISLSTILQTPDGTAQKINLLTGKVDPTAGQMTFQLTADKTHPDESGHIDWQYTITVTGGGLLARTGEFEFSAPSGGYQESVTVNLPKSLGTKWAESTPKQYFIKLANGQYLRGDLSVSVGSLATDPPSWTFDGYLNPSGSTNLEWDPKKVAR